MTIGIDAYFSRGQLTLINDLIWNLIPEQKLTSPINETLVSGSSTVGTHCKFDNKGGSEPNVIDSTINVSTNPGLFLFNTLPKLLRIDDDDDDDDDDDVT